MSSFHPRVKISSRFPNIKCDVLTDRDSYQDGPFRDLGRVRALHCFDRDAHLRDPLLGPCRSSVVRMTVSGSANAFAGAYGVMIFFCSCGVAILPPFHSHCHHRHSFPRYASTLRYVMADSHD